MEDIAKLGDLALRLEKYRYNLIASLGWVIFGMLFGAAVMIFNGLTVLFGFNPWYVAACLISAGIIGGLAYGLFRRFIPKVRGVSKRWRIGTAFLFLPFIIAYFIEVFSTYTSAGISLLLDSLVSLTGHWIIATRNNCRNQRRMARNENINLRRNPDNSKLSHTHPAFRSCDQLRRSDGFRFNSELDDASDLPWGIFGWLFQG